MFFDEINLTKHICLQTLDMKSLKTKIQYMHVNDQQIQRTHILQDVHQYYT